MNTLASVATRLLLVALLAGAGVSVGVTVRAQDGDAGDAQTSPTPARAPVLVELFTSEGCSSCPPADRLLARILEHQPVDGAEVIALGFHVDYWDRLGWRDRFSSPRYTMRQNAYAHAWGQADNVFTPQAVVDGTVAFNGGDWEKARQAIAQCATTPKLAVTLELAEAASERPSLRVGVAAPEGRASAPLKGDVMIAVTQDNLVSDVQRGENAKKRLTHVAVVRVLDKLGRFDGRAPFTATRALSLDKDWPRGSVKIVVFVQDASSKRILGVASKALGPA